MGCSCCKEEQPPVDELDPFAVIQSKSEIISLPGTTLLGVYPIGDIIAYVFNSPNPCPGPNKFWFGNGVVEILCEQITVDLHMINKQIEFIKQNMHKWTDMVASRQ